MTGSRTFKPYNFLTTAPWYKAVIRVNYSGICPLRSGKDPKLTIPWRQLKDGNAAILVVQRNPAENLKE
jgi:hypothetical protein